MHLILYVLIISAAVLGCNGDPLLDFQGYPVTTGRTYSIYCFGQPLNYVWYHDQTFLTTKPANSVYYKLCKNGECVEDLPVDVDDGVILASVGSGNERDRFVGSECRQNGAVLAHSSTPDFFEFKAVESSMACTNKRNDYYFIPTRATPCHNRGAKWALGPDDWVRINDFVPLQCSLLPVPNARDQHRHQRMFSF